jgi:outer membrane protein, heavy metal efflux system
MHSIRNAVGALFAVGTTLTFSACVLAPREAKQEAAALARASEAYRLPYEERALPALPEHPGWEDVLRRALLANGDLEAAHFAWAAAVHRIERAGAYPNTALSLDFTQTFSGSGLKGFDRNAIGLGFDPMENLAFPSKVYQAAKVATAEARAAGERLLATKLDLQRRVLNGWFDYAWLAARQRLRAEKADWLRVGAETVAARVAAGEPRALLLEAETAHLLAENDLRTGTAELAQARARLNALLAREPDAALPPPAELEPPRPLPVDDGTLLTRAAAENPELIALAHDVQGKRDAVTLARLQYIPDVNPFVGIEGAASQAAGFALTIPTFLREVQGMIREARAGLQAATARARQATLDRAAAVVATLSAVRSAERQAELVDGPIRRAVENARASARLAYGAATVPFADLIAAEQTVLDVRLLAAEARTTREKSLADLEALIGADVEALERSTTVAAQAVRP